MTVKLGHVSRSVATNWTSDEHIYCFTAERDAFGKIEKFGPGITLTKPSKSERRDLDENERRELPPKLTQPIQWGNISTTPEEFVENSIPDLDPYYEGIEYVSF